MSRKNVAPVQTPQQQLAPATAKVRVSQADLPLFPIARCVPIARALWDYYGGLSAPPVRLAASMNISATSSIWRYVTGAAAGYGITDGSFNAKAIELTPLGRRCVAPTEEGQDVLALREAVLRPTIHHTFLKRLDQRRLPADAIALNILAEMGVPPERRQTTLQIIQENARSVGFLLDNKGNTFIDLGAATQPATRSEVAEEKENKLSVEEALEPPFSPPADSLLADERKRQQVAVIENKKVFISHGANREIVEQLKKILTYGKYEPIVAVERETTAKPISEKVFDAMRSCFAGVINVHSEGEWQAPDGAMYPKLNENVLIEIGAAMALYPDRYILLVQEGVKLPSNVAGLYQCRYTGDQLGFEAAMKLLESFNKFEST